MVTIDGIPVYNAIADEFGLGIERISLVDDPAVQSNFLAFNKDRKPQMYAVQDEDQHRVIGVVMRADFPIYRKDPGLGEYYVMYSAEVIRQMAERYLLKGRQNEVNTMHVPGSDVDGVNMVQYFIKGKGLSPEGFDDISDGSLFAEFHVTNSDVWAAIKAGTYRGFSLEGVFDLTPAEDKDRVQAIVDTLEGKFSKILKNSKTDTTMAKIKGLLARLAKALVELGNVTTDKGILAWDGAEDLKEGDAVYIEDAEGERTTAADGDYTTEDGKVITVAGGKVAAINDGEAEVASTTDDPAETGSVKTDKGTLTWNGTEDLKEGDEVFGEDGEPAGDGDYVTEDGKTITVVDGKVASISDPAAEVSQEGASQKMSALRRAAQAFSESYDEKRRKIFDAIVAAGYDEFGYLVDCGDDFAVYESYDEDYNERYTRFAVSWDAEGNAVVSDPVEVVPAFVTKEERDAADASFQAMQSEKEALSAQVEELKAQLAKTPAARSAHEEFKAAPIETGKPGLNRLAELMKK